MYLTYSVYNRHRKCSPTIFQLSPIFGPVASFDFPKDPCTKILPPTPLRVPWGLGP